MVNSLDNHHVSSTVRHHIFGTASKGAEDQNSKKRQRQRGSRDKFLIYCLIINQDKL